MQLQRRLAQRGPQDDRVLGVERVQADDEPHAHAAVCAAVRESQVRAGVHLGAGDQVDLAAGGGDPEVKGVQVHVVSPVRRRHLGGRRLRQTGGVDGHDPGQLEQQPSRLVRVGLEADGDQVAHPHADAAQAG